MPKKKRISKTTTNRISATKIDGSGAASSIPTPTSGEYSLYYHVPFCKKKCDYCHFYVIPDKESDKDLLLEGFRREFQLRKPSGKLVSLYFGGGTPSLFGPERVQEVISWSPPCSEITLEANPDGIDLKLLKAYRNAGISRLSFGVQSFDNADLVQLGRTHSASQAEKALLLTCEAGFDSVSLDLMYDLPFQDLSHWEKSLKRAASLPIQHLSLYNLTLEPATLFFKKKESLMRAMPSPELSLRLYQRAQEILTDAGFYQYEISAFAKPGFYSRHNTGYWLGRPFLGLGPSAFSYWNHKRFRNVAHLRKYLATLSQNEFPVDFEEELSPQARERELFALHLRLLQGAPLPSFQDELVPLAEQGLLSFGPPVKLTSKGILLYDTIASEII